MSKALSKISRNLVFWTTCPSPRTSNDVANTIQTPQQILADLGIRDPEDLDIDAIAEYCGASIRYKALTGCEARVIGYRDRAIITINATAWRGRQRFSGGHELGHWMCDRGQIAFQCDYINYVRGWWAANPETRANRFAGDLL